MSYPIPKRISAFMLQYTVFIPLTHLLFHRPLAKLWLPSGLTAGHSLYLVELQQRYQPLHYTVLLLQLDTQITKGQINILPLFPYFRGHMKPDELDALIGRSLYLDKLQPQYQLLHYNNYAVFMSYTDFISEVTYSLMSKMLRSQLRPPVTLCFQT